MDVLNGHAINGYQGADGVMPAKGGNMSLSNDDVINAVALWLNRVARLCSNSLWRGNYNEGAPVGHAYICARVASSDRGPVKQGKEIAWSRKKGNCLTCHMMDGGQQTGNSGPPLMAMKARYRIEPCYVSRFGTLQTKPADKYAYIRSQ